MGGLLPAVNSWGQQTGGVEGVVTSKAIPLLYSPASADFGGLDVVNPQPSWAPESLACFLS